MTFQETLDRHLEAIRSRDLRGLADTVADDVIVLITAEGRLVRSAEEFLAMHRDWFSADGWSLEAAPVSVMETPEMGVAVLKLDYREPPATRQESYLTLVFGRRGDRWLMVQDQNTPIRP